MYKSIVMHELDYNYIAPCEEWYYRYHGPQLSRRYGPWLARFESFRPVPLPGNLDAQKLGYTNWLTTIGYWREIPLTGPRGELCLTTPPVNARNFGAMFPPQPTEDLKGADLCPTEKSCLRLLVFWQYPPQADKEEADAFFLNVLAKEISAVPEVYRFFSSRTVTEEIPLPGTWKPKQMEELMRRGNPSDHTWDRMAELHFETFDQVRAFFAASKSFSRPEWAETKQFPFLTPYLHLASTFLLERPAFDWMKDYNVYR